MQSACPESSFSVTDRRQRSLKVAMDSLKYSQSVTRYRGNPASGLTTAIHPRAGMLSLTAERWLNIALPRFLSLKVWISWIFSDIGFRSAATSFCKQTLSTVTENRTEVDTYLHVGLRGRTQDLPFVGAFRIEWIFLFSFCYGKTVFSFSEVWKLHLVLTLLTLSPGTCKIPQHMIQPLL